MYLLPKNLRIVILESPYDQINDPQVKALLGETEALKINGYKGVYPYGVLPVDTYDFVATHHLVCDTSEGKLDPIMGYKSITLQKCNAHRLSFPGLTVLRSSQASLQERALQDLLDRHKENPAGVSFGSSWTIAPKIRRNAELRAFLKDLTTAMNVCYEQEAGTWERVTCGVLKVKTDQFFLEMGYLPLTLKGEPLPCFEQASLIGDQVMMLHCTKFSDSALMIADQLRGLWNSRLVISGSEKNTEENKAA